MLQLSLDGADRLAARLQERQEPLSVSEAARELVRAERVPGVLARRLVEEVVRHDARLAFRSADEIALAVWRPSRTALLDAVFCVVDLETTGMRPAADRIVEIGAVRIEALERTATFERLVDPAVPLPAPVARLTGIDNAALRRAGPVGPALEELIAFAGDAVLVAHNARFDVAFLDAELSRLGARRLACPVVDTVGLARRVLERYRGSCSLGALAERFATDVRPCHRALADALATAEILLALIGRAQEQGAACVDDLVALSAPAPRRAQSRGHLAEAAPRAPGTYVMRDAGGRALYVGTAGDLRARTRGYFRSSRQPPALERVLPAVARLEYRIAGSAFEARLDEIELLDALRPSGNRRGIRAERAAYLRLEPAPVARLGVSARCLLDGACYVGPLGNRREVELVAAAVRRALALRSCRAAEPVEGTCLEGAVGRCLAPCRGRDERAAHAAAAGVVAAAFAGEARLPIERLRARRAALAAARRYEEAAALRDAEAALRRAGRRVRRLRSARALHGIVLAPHRDPALVTAFAVAHGLIAARRPLPRAGGAVLELRALVGELDRSIAAGPGLEGPLAVPAERYDELVHVAAAFLRPPRGVAAVPYGGRAPASLAAAAAGARRTVAG